MTSIAAPHAAPDGERQMANVFERELAAAKRAKQCEEAKRLRRFGRAVERAAAAELKGGKRFHQAMDELYAASAALRDA